MHLAMDSDHNIKERKLKIHRKEVKGFKKFILERWHMIRRIEVLVCEERNTV